MTPVSRQQVLVDLLLIFIAALLAAWPILLPGLIDTYDGPLHLFRLLELDRLIRCGIPFSRWAPDLFFGYGYPVFNYYPTLSYYVLEVLHVLGLSPVAAMKAGFLLSFAIAGWSMYALAHGILPPASPHRRPAALLGATAYIGLPHLFHEVYIRGALPGLFALAILPAVIWATGRLAKEASVTNAVLAGAFGGFLVLLHHVIALLAAPLLVCWWMWCLLFRYWGKPWQGAASAAGALALALGLSAGYWLPALLEREFVQLGRAAGAFDPHSLLCWPSSWVQSSWLVHQSPETPGQMGLVHTLLFVSMFAFVLWRRRVTAPLLFFLVAGVAAIFMMMPFSAVLWEGLPLMGFVQSPERFLCFVGLATALWTGAGIAALPPTWPSARTWTLAALLAVASIAVNTVGLHPAKLAIPETSISLYKLHRLEYDKLAAGASASGEFLPIWVEENAYTVPRPSARLAEGATQAEDLSAVPNVEITEWKPLAIRLQVLAHETAPLVFHAFYFPGWNGYLDGEAVSLKPQGPLGLIAADISPGEHSFELRFESTTARGLGDTLSLSSLVILLALGLRTFGRKILLATALMAAIVLLAWLRAQSGTAVAHYQEVGVVFADVARLVGLELDQSQVESRGIVRLVLYWHALRPIKEDGIVAISLRDEQGIVWARRERRPRDGTSPTQAWERGELIPDPHILAVPPQIPSASYEVEVSLGPEGTVGQRPWGSATVPLSVPLGQRITPPYPNGTWFNLGGQAALVGYALPPTMRAGQPLKLTLYWQALSVVEKDYTVFVHLADEEGRIWAQQDNYPRRNAYPTSYWDDGEIIEDSYDMLLPPETPPGTYRLYAGMYLFDTMKRLPVSGPSGEVIGDAVLLGTVEVVP